MVEASFEIQPTGFKLTTDSETFRVTKTFVSWEGYALNVSAPRQKYNGGRECIDLGLMAVLGSTRSRRRRNRSHIRGVQEAAALIFTVISVLG
jgi:hypothetical protein